MCNDTRSSLLPKQVVPEGGLEPPIFGLGDRRLIHWATRALLTNSMENANFEQHYRVLFSLFFICLKS